ncbi:MAG: hypothetical protein V3R20_00880 [Sphingomonadales bacterium]
MLKQFISLAAAASLISISMPSSVAGPETYDPFAHYGYPSKVSGGFYLKIPFNGRIKKSATQGPRFGFALKAKLGSGYGTSMHPLSAPMGTNLTNGMVNIVDLSFGFSGTDSFRFNDLSLTDVKTALNAEEDEKKGSAIPWIIGGVLVAGGIAVVVATKNTLNCLPACQ